MYQLLYSFLLFALIFCSSKASALVDYSGPSDSENRANKIESSPSFSKKENGRGTSNASFDFGTSYEMVSVSDHLGGGKAGISKVDGRFQTEHNLFFDFNYWMANTSSSQLSQESGYEKGNATLLFGFNWLKFGAPEEMVNVDLYLGGMLPQNDSHFASTRTDKILGVETSKRFLDVALGFGYEYRITDTPNDASEVAIGNMQKMNAGIGWQATGDIRFLLEASRVDINAYGDKNSRRNSLREKISYGQISPSLELGIAKFLKFSMGARFQTQKMKTGPDVMNAKLWSNDGAYGSSFFVGLGVGI